LAAVESQWCYYTGAEPACSRNVRYSHVAINGEAGGVEGSRWAPTGKLWHELWRCPAKVNVTQGVVMGSFGPVSSVAIPVQECVNHP
jgi:hypothetical protein